MVKIKRKLYYKNILIYLIIIILLIILFIFFNKFKKENFQNIKNIENKNIKKNKIAFCLLTRKPNISWLNFLNMLLDKYDTYVVIDDKGDYLDFINKYRNINFIQIDDEECINNGYYYSDYVFKPVVNTDRAYYYFNKIKNNYEHIWFCEDDVFIYDKKLLLDLDKKYANTDFIVPGMEINTKGISDKRWVHWNKIEILLDLPWAHWIICLCRISNNLMKKVDEFVIKNKKLNYKEFLFHTLAIHNNMSIEIPVELKHIHLNELELEDLEIIKEYNPIYHPVKNMEYHEIIRNQNK